MNFPAYTAALLMLLAVPALAETPATPPPASPAPAAAEPPAPPAAAPVSVTPGTATPGTATPGAAAALGTAAQATLANFVTQPDYQAAIIATGKGQVEHVPGTCPAAKFQATGEVGVLAPVRFNKGKPASGAWSEKISVTGCGALRMLNVLTIAHPEGDPVHIAMMPGDTRTDPLMQKTALQYAQAVAVRAAPRNCKEQAFVDTKFEGFTGLPNPEVRDGRDGRAWEETWTVSACGTLYDIHLLFAPNANGTELRGSNPVKRS
jgi:hypothetical protein